MDDQDEPDGSPGPEQPEDFGDALRQQAARFAHAADSHERLSKSIENLHESMRQAGWPQNFGWMKDHSDAAAYRLQTMQRLTAEQAMAYDEMIAAGGPDNEEAYSDYAASSEFRKALLPTDFSNPDLDSRPDEP